MSRTPAHSTRASVNSDSVSLATVEELMTRQEERFKELLQFQANTYQELICKLTESTNKRVDGLIESTTKKLCDMQHSLEFTQAEVKDMGDQLTAHARAVKADLTSVSAITDCQHKYEEKLDYLENQTRRCNIRIDGIAEGPGETWDRTEAAVREMISSKLELDGRAVEIERAHRVGKPSAAAVDDPHAAGPSPRPRSICVKFLRFKDKSAVLKSAKKLKNTGVYINEDYSELVMAKRKEQLPKLREAREQGKIAYFSYDKLVIRNMRPSSF